MTPSDWQRIQEIFLAALEQPDDTRTAFVCDQSADPAILSEVRRLLAGHGAGGAILDTDDRECGGDGVDESKAALPRIVGSYRLLELIGSGGMGSVYRAERSDGQFRKQVAVKLITGNSLPDRAIARFCRERQFLADLEHPHIARLLDGGVAADGQQHIVMEYVDGTRIDRYCREAHLNAREIALLFRRVCEAVAYAHRKGIIHRDIKPANLLVAADGSPKLLDFGISRLMGESEGQEDGRHEYSTIALTPEYCSPEQLSRRDATPASDVYSLGVVLYELLTGRPFCDAERGERAPPRLGIPHSLYAVALKAVEPDPLRRYPSAAEFADDLQRHCQSQPTQARPRALLPRIGVHLAYRRWRAISLLLVIAAIGGGVAWRRVEKRRESSRRVAVVKAIHELFVETDARSWRLPDAADARRRLFAEVAQRLASVERDAAGDPDLLRAIALCYAHLGRAQGGMSVSVGDFRKSLESYGRARVHAEQSLQISGSFDDLRLLMMILEGCAAAAQFTNELTTVDRCAGETLSLLERHRAKYLAYNQAGFVYRLLTVSSIYSGSLINQERLKDAHDVLERADHLVEPLLSSLEKDLSVLGAMAGLKTRLAEFLCLGGNAKAGMGQARVAASLAKRFTEREPREWHLPRSSSSIVGQCYLADGQNREAHAIFADLESLYAKDVRRDPANLFLRLWLARSRELAGNALLRMNDLSKAEHLYLAALDVLQSPPELAINSLALGYAGKNYAGIGHIARIRARRALGPKAALKYKTASCENYRRAEQILRECERSDTLTRESRIALREVAAELVNCSAN